MVEEDREDWGVPTTRVCELARASQYPSWYMTISAANGDEGEVWGDLFVVRSEGNARPLTVFRSRRPPRSALTLGPAQNDSLRGAASRGECLSGSGTGSDCAQPIIAAVSCTADGAASAWLKAAHAVKLQSSEIGVEPIA